jgi:xanthine dehydrogenase accessory factor
MRAELLKLAAELAGRGEAFVFAVVVRREPASSAQPGNMAIVTEGGTMHGWLGGSCIQPTVVREAELALAEGRPRYVALAPDPAGARRPGVIVHPMTCHSGGTVDIYLEPVLPAPRLLVFGGAPIARALCRLGKAMGWAVDAVLPDAEPAAFPEADRVLARPEPPTPAQSRSGVFAVVSTMGERDEDALSAAVAVAPAYLGVVASRRRYADLRDALLARGVAASALERVKNPAGKDIGAKTPEEIAVSVLAEIVELRSAGAARAPPPEAAARPAATAVDPICGMTVVVATARHVAEHAGRTWYFCNPRCREKFLAAPERWAETAAGTSP